MNQFTDLSPSFPGWSPAATMYVLPMVLIFSKTLNFGLDSNCNENREVIKFLGNNYYNFQKGCHKDVTAA